MSDQVDEALERQRAITGTLDEQIADVKAQISQSQLQQQRRQDTVIGARPSLRWNLVPDEHIISPRRSRQSGLTSKGSRSPSRQSLPPLLNPPAFGDADAAAFSGQNPTFADAGQTTAPLGVEPFQPTSGQVALLPADIQNYQNFNAQGQQFVAPGTGGGDF